MRVRVVISKTELRGFSELKSYAGVEDGQVGRSCALVGLLRVACRTQTSGFSIGSLEFHSRLLLACPLADQRLLPLVSSVVANRHFVSPAGHASEKIFLKKPHPLSLSLFSSPCPVTFLLLEPTCPSPTFERRPSFIGSFLGPWKRDKQENRRSGRESLRRSDEERGTHL